MGAGHPAADVERGAGQPEVAGVDVAGVPPGAATGEGSRAGDADGGTVTRRAKSGPRKDAARAVSLTDTWSTPAFCRSPGRGSRPLAASCGPALTPARSCSPAGAGRC